MLERCYNTKLIYIKKINGSERLTISETVTKSILKYVSKNEKYLETTLFYSGRRLR